MHTVRIRNTRDRNIAILRNTLFSHLSEILASIRRAIQRSTYQIYVSHSCNYIKRTSKKDNVRKFVLTNNRLKVVQNIDFYDTLLRTVASRCTVSLGSNRSK